jgi:hypothetical protein
LSRVSPADPVAAYRHGVVLIIGFFLAAGAVSAVLLTGRPVVASDPGLAVTSDPGLGLASDPGLAVAGSTDEVAGGPVPAAAQDR